MLQCDNSDGTKVIKNIADEKRSCNDFFSSASFLSAANAKISLIRFGYIVNGINQTLPKLQDSQPTAGEV